MFGYENARPELNLEAFSP